MRHAAHRNTIYEAIGKSRFKPPIHGKGNDWVLVLDDASQGFSAPGKAL